MSTGGGTFDQWAVLSASFETTDPELWTAGGGHLVIEASPLPLSAARFLFHGPPGELIPAGTAAIDGVVGTWYRVSPGNIGSIFQFHLVLIWTAMGHTYGVGFHNWSASSRALGLEVAESLVYVNPEANA